MGDEEALVNTLIGVATYGAITAARAAVTSQAAQAEEITFEEIRLRENVARYRSRAKTRWTARGRRRAAAQAATCDEQIARFEETRRKKMNQAGGEYGMESPTTMLPNDEEFRFCTQCAGRNGAQSRFCNECGTQLNVPVVSAYNPQYNYIKQ